MIRGAVKNNEAFPVFSFFSLLALLHSRNCSTNHNGLLTDHPITKGRDVSERINRVMTFTGQSITGTPGSIALLKLALSIMHWLSGLLK
jgi:hypothetical protein